MPRRPHEPPRVVQQGWRYHHLGIPTTVPRRGEVYMEDYGMYVTGFEESPYGIEWMRFEPGSPVHELVQHLPHIAFVVDDLEAALQDQELLSAISSPCAGCRVAMIVHDGAPVELMEFEEPTMDRGPCRACA